MIFETERLLLRPIEKSDAERLFLMDKNPMVMHYIGIPPLTDIQQTLDYIDNIHEQYKKFGIGRYAVVDKALNTVIGWSGLKMNTDTVNEHQNFYELGYRFMPEFWGKGYATESSKPFLEHAFKTLKVESVAAYVHHENLASQHVLEKLNFEKTNEFLETDGICYWYEILNKNYTL